MAGMNKRGYAFQVRRCFRIFCLLFATAGAFGIWIGVTTVLGRASITERFAPDNELAIRVKGCDVRVIKSSSNKVVLNRWRGSGMNQRLYYATSGDVIFQLDAVNARGCSEVHGFACQSICEVTVHTDPSDPPVRVDVRQMSDDDNTDHVRFRVEPGVKAGTIWLAGARIEVDAEGAEASSLVVRGGRGDVYAVDNTFGYADLRSPNGAVYLLETKVPAARTDLAVRWRSNTNDVCMASVGSAAYVPDTLSQGSVWSGTNDGSWGAKCEPLNPNFYFPRTRNVYDADKDGFVTTDEFDEGVASLDKCCGGGCPFRSFCGSLSNQLFAPRPSAGSGACCSRTGVVETFEFVKRLRELNDTSLIPLCQRNIALRDAAAPASPALPSVTASIWADDGSVRVHRRTEADPTATPGANSTAAGALEADPVAGLSFWTPAGGIPGLKMHRADSDVLLAELRDVFGATSSTSDVFVTIDVVGSPGVPGGRWVWTTRPIFLYLQPSLLQFLSGGLLNPPLRSYRVHMSNTQCDSAALTDADGNFNPGKPRSDADHSALAARQAAVFKQLRTALTPRFQLEMRGVLVQVGESHQPLPDTPHLTAYGLKTDGSVVSAPFATSNDESTTAAVLLSVGMAFLVACALTGFLLLYMRSALKSRYSRERVRAKLLSVRAEATRTRHDKETAEALQRQTSSPKMAAAGDETGLLSGEAKAGADAAAPVEGLAGPPGGADATSAAAAAHGKDVSATSVAVEGAGKDAKGAAPVQARDVRPSATGGAEPRLTVAVAKTDAVAVEAEAGDGSGTDGVDTGDLDSSVESRSFNPLETPVEVVNMLLVAPVRRQVVDSVRAFVNQRCNLHVKPPDDDDDDDDGCCGCCGGGGARSGAAGKSASVRPASTARNTPGLHLSELPAVTFDEFHERYCAFTYSQDLSEVQSRAQLQQQLIMEFNLRVRGQLRETLQGLAWKTADGTAPPDADSAGLTGEAILSAGKGGLAAAEAAAAAQAGSAAGGKATPGGPGTAVAEAAAAAAERGAAPAATVAAAAAAAAAPASADQAAGAGDPEQPAPPAPAYDESDALLLDAFLERHCDITKKYSADAVLLNDLHSRPQPGGKAGTTTRGLYSLLTDFCEELGVEEPTREETLALLAERGVVYRKRRHKRIYGLSFMDGSAAAARPRLGCTFFAVESFSVLVHMAVFFLLPVLCIAYALQMQFTHGVTVATASQRALSRFDLAQFPPVLTGQVVFVVHLIVAACAVFLALGFLRILVRYVALPRGILRTFVRKAFAMVLVVVVFSMFFVIGLVLAWFVLAAALDPTRFLPYGAGAICALVVALTTFKQLSRAAAILRTRIQQAFKGYMAKATAAAKTAMEQTAKFERQRQTQITRRKAARGGAAAQAAVPTKEEEADFKVEDIFGLVNSDGDGELSRAEFDDLFERLNVNLSASKRDQLFSMSDADGSGMIDQQEFVDAWERIEEEIVQDTLESLGVSDAAIAGFVLYLLLLLGVTFAFIFTAIRAWENSSSFEAVVQSLLVTGSGVLTQVTRSRPKGEDGDEQSISEIVDSVVKGDEAS